MLQCSCLSNYIEDLTWYSVHILSNYIEDLLWHTDLG